MRKLISILSLFLLFSCGNSETIEKNPTTKDGGRIVYDYGLHTKIRVFEVDSCEYIGFDSGSKGGTSIIHKNNCKFCAKRNGNK